MRPVTDRTKISREKLAYPEDGSVSGMETFIQAIPLNLYAMLSIFMVLFLTLKKKSEFGPMLVADRLAEQGVFSSPEGDVTEDNLSDFGSIW